MPVDTGAAVLRLRNLLYFAVETKRPLLEQGPERNPKTMSSLHEDWEARFRADLATSRVPDHLRDGIVMYLAHGIPAGSFLNAVLSNDLIGACRFGDFDSRAGLFDLVAWLCLYAPAIAWGSADNVSVWVTEKAAERRTS